MKEVIWHPKRKRYYGRVDGGKIYPCDVWIRENSRSFLIPSGTITTGANGVLKDCDMLYALHNGIEDEIKSEKEFKKILKGRI